MTNDPLQLTLEQQFSQRSFESQVDRMSLDQAQYFLKELHKQMLFRESLYKKLMHTDGLGSISFTLGDIQ